MSAALDAQEFAYLPEWGYASLYDGKRRREPLLCQSRETRVALAYAGGFRRAELVALDVTDYDRDVGDRHRLLAA